jgi:transcriptional regulator with XRE-family HTH domain
MGKRKVTLTLMAKLRKLLADKGWSVAELARRINAPQQKVDRFIKASRLPATVLMGVKIAKALNVPPEWLFDDNQNFPPPGTSQKLQGPQAEVLADMLERLVAQIRESNRP